MLHPDSIKLNEFSFTKIENLLKNHPSIKKVTVYSDWHGQGKYLFRSEKTNC